MQKFDILYLKSNMFLEKLLKGLKITQSKKGL